MSREEKIALLAAALLKPLFKTLRISIHDPYGFLTAPPSTPFLAAFWHNRILAITPAFLRFYPPNRKGLSVLTSPSRDGEILAQVAARFGMNAIRGSSSKRGAIALRECLSHLRLGRDIAITPDGPRGPRYVLNPGIILLSSQTSIPILPIHANFSCAIRLKTWDKFYIPLPFSKINIKLLKLQFISPPSDNSHFEAERKRIEALLSPHNHNATQSLTPN
ncbi:MAG: lysophospholipid acyltransferase family protein [Chthoniobacterales bacterium]|nr:lysophospholipid acyltransferase family protein [Chthoniobacterales bacterium]